MAVHKSNEDATTAAGATMIALSVIVVVCRFYMRLKLKSGLKWDDWFILISLLTLITAGVLVVAGTFVCFPHSLCDAQSIHLPNSVFMDLKYLDSSPDTR